MGKFFAFIMYFTPVMLVLALLAIVLMLLGAKTVALWISYALLGYCLVLVLTGIGIVIAGVVQLGLKTIRKAK
ncbi:MAG: hypothetical protein NTW61_05645 [Candidatus Melainabacteria bacterium]|jgi:hypothetical protein|nr:hypothetical protein [Candidatus Melainabacteria bacterium]